MFSSKILTPRRWISRRAAPGWALAWWWRPPSRRPGQGTPPTLCELIGQEVSNDLDTGLGLVKSDHMTWILASDWLRVITWAGYWPLIGQEWSHELDTSLWLVKCDHMNWIPASKIYIFVVNPDFVILSNNFHKCDGWISCFNFWGSKSTINLIARADISDFNI